MSMRDYEALVILRAGGTEQDVARNATHLEEPIKKVGGSVASNQGMGRRKLAFRISRQTEGYYYLLRFQAPTEQLGELERFFHLNETVVRFMILSSDEIGPPSSTAARPASAHAGAVPAGARAGSASARN